MTKKKNNKKVKILPIILLIFLAAVVGMGLFILVEYRDNTDEAGAVVTVEVSQGSTVREIGSILKEKGVINSKIAFYLKVKAMDAGSSLKYGTFELNDGYCLETVINELVNNGAKKEGNWFTVPEGYTIEKIALKLEEEGYFTKEEFLTAVEQDIYDYWFLESIPADADVNYRLQGFLFPDTYDLGDEVTPEGVVRTMLDHFGTLYTKDMDAKARQMGRTTFEIITEASMIERETSIDSERATIAGVIENRLADGMRLQIDPTFLYPITSGMYDKSTATYEDTRTDSPYNTYVNYGLPVGPICNPGLSSIEGALNPEQHEYFFYHTNEEKNDGSHLFTRTYDEHLNTQK